MTIRSLLLAAALASGLLLGGCATNPVTGRSDVVTMSAAQEVEIGRRMHPQILQEYGRYADEAVQTYVSEIGQRIAAKSHRPDLQYTFTVLDSEEVNAFALPGGYVGVHLGLIALTTSRDELASVLAHELTHITQRHIARGIVNSKRQSLLAVAGMIIGIIAAGRANSADAANAVIAGSQAAQLQGQLNFSRDMEREADRVGFAVLAGAGFARGGMASMFDKLDSSSRLNDSGAYPYLRSHPLNAERIGDARARAGDAIGSGARGDLEHAAAQARARVLMDIRTDALLRWQAEDAERAGAGRNERFASALQSALASTLLRDYARADAALGRAAAIARESGEARAGRAVGLLAAQSLVARGDGAAALRTLERFTAEGSRPVLLLTAQAAALLPAGDPAVKRSADELQTWVALRPQDALAWLLLSPLWTRLAQPLRALRAEAEARIAIADLGGAIERLRAGQRLARESPGKGAADHIDASVIDARLREVEAQRRRELAADRAERGERTDRSDR